MKQIFIQIFNVFIGKPMPLNVIENCISIEMGRSLRTSFIEMGRSLSTSFSVKCLINLYSTHEVNTIYFRNVTFVRDDSVFFGLDTFLTTCVWVSCPSFEGTLKPAYNLPLNSGVPTPNFRGTFETQTFSIETKIDTL